MPLERRFGEFFLQEKVTYFKVLMTTVGITCFSALLVFTIQNQNHEILAFMGAASLLNFVLIFQANKLKPYFNYIFPSLYLFYLTAMILILLYGTNVPYFILGYPNGIVYASITLFCPPKVQVVYIIATPWILLTFMDIFTLGHLPYIVFTLSAFIILALICYQFANTQRQLYLEIIKQFTSDCLLAISYDDQARQFNLEFTNILFENTYTEDFKEFLRANQVLPDGDVSISKKNLKLETLEEFLFQFYKKKINLDKISVINLKIKNKNNDLVQEVKITRTFVFSTIFIITIKNNKSNAQVERYEKKLKNIKQIIISLSNETGLQLQDLYHSLHRITDLGNKIFQKQKFRYDQSDILQTLNRMKNYIIYYQRERFEFLHSQMGYYLLNVFFGALKSYFEIKCFQKKRTFFNKTSYMNPKLRINQKLLTQLLVNIFNIVLKVSSIGSIIILTISQEDNMKYNKQGKQDLTNQSNKDIPIFLELQGSQIIQFKFSFASDEQLDNLDQQLSSNLEDSEIENEEMIVSSVNFMILGMIAPYNQIYYNSNQVQSQDQYQNEVIFQIYTDQTKLEQSYMKQNQFKRDE